MVLLYKAQNIKSRKYTKPLFFAALILTLLSSFYFAYQHINKLIEPQNLAKFYKDKGYHVDGLMNWDFRGNTQQEVHLERFKKAFTEYADALLRTNNLPTININIDFKAWEKIKKQRQKAVKQGVYNPRNSEYVKATIQHDNKNTKIKLRLKGWLPDHWSHKNKWSFKVKTRKGDAFMGMSKFAIQHPRTREYQYEQTAFSISKKLGIITPRFLFANVYINGESIGIMNIEEQYSKELVELNEKKEGSFLKLSFLESNDITVHTWFKPRSYERAIFINSFVRTSIQGTKNRNVAKPFYKNLEQTGISLFRGLMQGDLKPSDIFDIEQTGKYLALMDVLSSNHGLAVPNQTYYFNPVTYKLEPVPSETLTPWGGANNTLWDVIQNKDGNGYELWNLIKGDELIYKASLKSMENVSDKIQQNLLIATEQIDQDFYSLKKEFLFVPPVNTKAIERKFIDSTYPTIQANKFTPYAEGPKEYNISLDNLTNSAKGKKIGVITIAYLTQDKEQLYLEFANLLPEHTTIEEINIIKTSKSGSKPFTHYSKQTLPIRLPPTPIYGKPAIISIPLHNLVPSDKIIITGKTKRSTADTLHAFKVNVYNYQPIAQQHPIAPSTPSKILAKNKFLTYDKTQNMFTVKKGTWNVNNFIITPYASTLKIPAGTTLNFAKEAGILLRGKLLAEGTKANKITLKPQNKQDSWRGITILKSNFYSNLIGAKQSGKSIINHTIIANTNYSKHKSWEVTGAITFYESDVDILNTHFNGTQAEDELNIVRSKFTMNNVTFSDSRSDAFDSDFSHGTITNTTFKGIGGDGLDFSGSDVTASEVYFDKVHDKAISVGEASKFTGSNLTINNSGTGVASKDGSLTKISDSKFINIGYAILMAYEKKNEYGGAKIIANDINYTQKKNDIIAQKGSSIQLDNKFTTPRKVNIEKLYKEGYMKK